MTRSILTTAALLAAFAAPASAHYGTEPSGSSNAAPVAGTYQDLRSPDARDAAISSESRQYSDLRSPDARDVARASIESGKQDLRSPDARDVGREPVTVQIPEPVVEIHEVPGSGFDWGDAGIGAAGMLALFSIAGGVALLAVGRRRRRGVQTAH